MFGNRNRCQAISFKNIFKSKSSHLNDIFHDLSPIQNNAK